MIKCHLSRLMGERKMKVVDVSRATGIHRNMVTLLYKETATRIDLVDEVMLALEMCVKRARRKTGRCHHFTNRNPFGTIFPKEALGDVKDL